MEDESVTLKLTTYEQLKKDAAELVKLKVEIDEAKTNVFHFIAELVKNDVYFVDSYDRAIGHEDIIKRIINPTYSSVDVRKVLALHKESGLNNVTIKFKYPK